jgi:hypothetical protein
MSVILMNERAQPNSDERQASKRIVSTHLRRLEDLCDDSSRCDLTAVLALSACQLPLRVARVQRSYMVQSARSQRQRRDLLSFRIQVCSQTPFLPLLSRILGVRGLRPANFSTFVVQVAQAKARYICAKQAIEAYDKAYVTLVGPPSVPLWLVMHPFIVRSRGLTLDHHQ